MSEWPTEARIAGDDGSKVAVISARVHPGESNASWMMEGFIEAITADTPEAAEAQNLKLSADRKTCLLEHPLHPRPRSSRA